MKLFLLKVLILYKKILTTHNDHSILFLIVPYSYCVCFEGSAVDLLVPVFST